MEGPGDEPLPARPVAGDERAFAALYDRFGKRLYRAAMGMLGRREDAEDVVHEVFLSLLKSRKRLLGNRDPTAYLFTALRHAAGRCAARRARRPVPFDAGVDETMVAQGQNDSRSNADSERLQRALQKLPIEQREVVAMKIDGELTFAEIGQVLGVSINTAASRYRYALEKLRNLLKESR